MPFQNRVLEKLFQGVLRNETVEFGDNLTDRQQIDVALEHLPMSLSQSQKDALYNAWLNEVSYVQGPPGTGKSHTIAAIMLSALLLKKKVLFVSQKKAAIDVVRRKIEGFLGENSLIYVGSESSERQKLKAYIEEKIRGITAYNFSSFLERHKQQLDISQSEMKKLVHEINLNKKALKICLETEQDYWRINNEYIKARNNFSELFGEAYTRNIQLNDELISNLSKEVYKRNIAIIQDKLLKESTFKRKDILYLRRFYKCCIDKLNADKDKFSSLSNLPLYLEQLFSLTCIYADSMSKRRGIAPNLNQRRQLINQKEQALLSKQKLYIKQRYEFNLLSSLQRHKRQVELFSKMLYWRKTGKILEFMRTIKYDILTTVFPLWAGEIKELGQFLPFQNELFDLVIVDEASQVNIAEIIPAFYRGKSFCVVGDDKQLGLSSAGLFALNKTFERLIWSRCFSGVKGAISYEEAEGKALIVSKSSILDFTTNKDNQLSVPKVMLNEHFRSMPQLAAFTSKRFYDGNLRIMTEVGKNIHKQCFEAIEVGGQREKNFKYVLEEVEELIKRLKGLIRNQDYLQEPLKNHGFTLKDKPTIGIVSFLTEQKSYIDEKIKNEFSNEERETYNLFVGTPEEFQGNERHIIFITLGLDGSRSWAKGHYENPNRFNVATSRAINYTYLIYGGISSNATLLKDYIRHFGYQPQNILDESKLEENLIANKHTWRFDEVKIESEFEFRVAEYLRDFINNYDSGCLELYNQVTSCGQKRLDFVLFNSKNEETCAVEVDGINHFAEDGRSYSEAHLERVDILQRAGWKIIHVPYHKWYSKGWLCDKNDPEFSTTLEDLYKHIREALLLN